MALAAWGDAETEAVFARADPPLYAVTIWPHRSMSRRGFGAVMALLAAGFAVPLLPLVALGGVAVLWPILLPALVAIVLTWALIERNYRDARVREELRIWSDAIAVERREARGEVHRWASNPYWVRTAVFDTPRRRKYLTLSGGGRTIELGAFLTPEERIALRDEIEEALRRAAVGRAPD